MAADTKAVELRAGAIVGGDFQVIRPIARGGMATIHEARQLSTSRTCALKVPRAGTLLKTAADDFRYEAYVTSRIHSEHVVHVLASGVEETGMPFLAMELLRGQDLASFVERNGSFSFHACEVLFGHLGHALGIAHAHGIVHRDIKPANVFLTEPTHRGDPFSAKLIDFGAARRCTARPRRQTRAIGSPLYMSPEQTRYGGVIGAATDVWAFGLLAFFVMTGRNFWRGRTLESVLDEVLSEPIPSASARARELGVALPPWAELDAWFVRCLQRDPDNRFPHAAAAAQAWLAIARAGSGPPDRQSVSPMLTPVGVAGVEVQVESVVQLSLLPQHAQTIPAPGWEAVTLEGMG